MDRFEELLTKLGYFSKFASECYLKRAKILIVKREFSMASYFLNQIIETNISIMEEDFSLSEPVEMDLIKIRAKVKLAEISEDNERSMDYFEEVGLFKKKIKFLDIQFL